MWLSGLKNALVVDIGGTTTDIGTLKDGFPREASTQREVRSSSPWGVLGCGVVERSPSYSVKRVCLLTPQIGGVATNFRLPDVVNVGLGGGSVVTVQDSGAGMVSETCVLCEKSHSFVL